jgi:cytochrome oxidase Cu insertion factor (SCO1/SenC/PrrC family)
MFKIKSNKIIFLFTICIIVFSCKSDIGESIQRTKTNINSNWLYLENNTKDIDEVLNQNSERVSLNDSTKRFQILSFFNNQCGDPCKALMHNLKWLDERFSDASNYRLTSLSTSTVDTPAVLLDYAKTNTIDLANRSLLYSTTEILNLVIKETLNTSLSEKQERVIYETLYLIDNQGYLRGIYDGTNTVDLENLILDSRIL